MLNSDPEGSAKLNALEELEEHLDAHFRQENCMNLNDFSLEELDYVLNLKEKSWWMLATRQKTITIS